MRKGSKKLLFFSICLFFAVITPAIIFYCLGYRFDFENRTIVKTGGLFFKVSPPGVTIYLDQKLYKKTNFFFENAFLSGLLPDDYEITIKKNDYHPWSKILTVEEEKVTEAKNIFLFPKNPEFANLAKEINGFFPSPNGKNIIFKIESKKGWVLNSFDIQTQKETEILNEQELQVLEAKESGLPAQKIAEINFLNLSWSPDSRKILLEVKIKGEKQYLVAGAAPETNLFVLDVEKNMKKVSFNPNNSEELFFIATEIESEKESEKKDKESEIKKQVLFRLKGDGQWVMLNISAPSFEQNIISYAVINDNILWLTDTGFLYKGRLIINSDKIDLLEILNLKPLNIQKEANYQVIAKNLSQILLKENEALYYLNPESHLFERIFDSGKKVEFSDDTKKIAVNTGNQIWLFYLTRELEQPSRKIEDKILLAGFPQTITNLFWLNNNYIIFQIENSIQISEIDNRSRVNLIELTTFPSPQIHWDQKQKTLLVLSEGNLFSCNNILK